MMLFLLGMYVGGCAAIAVVLCWTYCPGVHTGSDVGFALLGLVLWPVVLAITIIRNVALVAIWLAKAIRGIWRKDRT